jgi:glycosyltransferase involved in cell wall biosynthesis
MRIGIDGRALTGRYTGDRTYWLNLLRAMAAELSDGTELRVYSRLPIPPDALPNLPNITARQVPATNDRLWTLYAFGRALKRDAVDIAHTQYTTPLVAPCPIVTTVHDISFRLYPEWFPRRHRTLLNLTVPGAMRRAAHVITDSEGSRRDILRVYRLPQNQVSCVHLAAAPEFTPLEVSAARAAIQGRLKFEGPYLLSVGVLQPRKNLPLLLEGFARALRSADFPHRLVLTGKRGWEVEDLHRLVQRLQITDRVVWTDYVEDAELPALYNCADALAYPSLYEGFGLPPLEAMACGTPVLVSNAPAMPEIAGDAALILPVMDAVAWGGAIARVLTDSSCRAELRRAGLARAALFTWRDTALKTLEIYRRCLEGARPATTMENR